MLVRLLASLLVISTHCHAQHLWQQPKPLGPKAQLEKIIGPVIVKEPSRELKVLWVWGYDKGHKPGHHDYLRIRDLMSGLLRTVPKVTVEEVYQFPTKAQFAKADLVAFYLHLPPLTDEQYGEFQSYIKRGGGVVALHETAIMRPASEGRKLVECLGMSWDEGRSEWGALFEDIDIVNKHEIFRGFPLKLRIVDEFYWSLNRLDAIEVLGSVRTGPPGRSAGPVGEEQLSKDSSPVFWTLELGKGRVFGTTAGHNTFTYHDPEFRIVLFRAMAWALREKPDPFMTLVFDGITDSEGKVGTRDDMRDWEGKLRKPPGK